MSFNFSEYTDLYVRELWAAHEDRESLNDLSLAGDLRKWCREKGITLKDIEAELDRRE